MPDTVTNEGRENAPRSERAYLCFAEGRPGDWEAICIDLDIAVQATSDDAAKALLETAITTYVEDAWRESPEARDRLLNRRAPFLVRARYISGFLRHMLWSRHDGRFHAGFQMSCRA